MLGPLVAAAICALSSGDALGALDRVFQMDFPGYQHRTYSGVEAQMLAGFVATQSHYDVEGADTVDVYVGTTDRRNGVAMAFEANGCLLYTLGVSMDTWLWIKRETLDTEVEGQ